MKIKTALISVSERAGVVDFGRSLHQMGIKILSTGGTAKVLEEAGIQVVQVSDYTGFPEILDGRVKSLHPRIHGGILARHEDPGHQKTLEENEIQAIGLVVVNLYPFSETVSRAGVTLEEAVEQIDIGGPTLLRAAAKNFKTVTAVVDPSDYSRVLAELSAGEMEIRLETRQALALKVFQHISRYDGAIAEYLQGQAPEDEEALPSSIRLNLSRRQVLRYGENPHQRGAVYAPSSSRVTGLLAAEQLQGKTLSFNNYMDLEAAWRLVIEFSSAACVIIKHNNPCGTATAQNLSDAYQRALACDPISAFGSVIGYNREVDGQTAEAMKSLFVEAVIGPAFSDSALEVFSAKKNLRVMQLDWQPGTDVPRSAMGLDFKKISGGFLVQDRDVFSLDASELKIVTDRKPSEEQIGRLLFAWTVCKHVKSNAIVYAGDFQTLGIGAGQMSRVDSVRLGAEKAQLPLRDSVLASDAFFPFRDGIDEAVRVGVNAIIQPGGSIRDQEVIDAANQHDIAMVFTGIRHFRH